MTYNSRVKKSKDLVVWKTYKSCYGSRYFVVSKTLTGDRFNKEVFAIRLFKATQKKVDDIILIVRPDDSLSLLEL